MSKFSLVSSLASFFFITGLLLLGASGVGHKQLSGHKNPADQIETGINAINVEIENSAHETKYNQKLNPEEVLNKLLVREFSRPNKWGYKIQWWLGPDLNPNGLTYSVDFLADIPGCKIDSAEKVEQLQAEIYAESIEIANSIREIRPFLGEFPLTPESFQVSLGFLDENMQFVDPPYIISVIMRPHRLEFNYFLKEKSMDRFDEFLVKPLKECPGLAPFFHPHVKRCASFKKPVVPTYVAVPHRYNYPYGEALFGFSKKITSEKNLYLVHFGDAAKDFQLDEPFQIIFWGHHCLTLDEARLLAASVSGKFLHFVQTDPECPERMQTWRKRPRSPIDTDVPDSRHISLRLSFWDENIDRQPEPYIAEVRLCNQKMCFYTADENQVLKIVFEESFDESQAFLTSSSQTKATP